MLMLHTVPESEAAVKTNICQALGYMKHHVRWELYAAT